MVACLIELSCSIAPLSFSCFWTRAIPFLSFFLYPFFSAQSPFVTATVCLKCILQNGKCARVILWVDSFTLFYSCFHTQQWDWQMEIPQKPPQKWHERFSTSFHHNKLRYRGIVTVCFLSGRVSSVIPADILLFIGALSTPVSALHFVSVSPSTSHFSSLSTKPGQEKGDSCQWVYWIVW